MNAATPNVLVDGLTKEERSLLLYLESRAVDHRGLVDTAHMNADDMKIARRWSETRFLRFSRIRSDLLPATVRGPARISTHVVEMTPISWECAAIERRRRAERSQCKEVVQASLEHFETNLA